MRVATKGLLFLKFVIWRRRQASLGLGRSHDAAQLVSEELFFDRVIFVRWLRRVLLSPVLPVISGCLTACESWFRISDFKYSRDFLQVFHCGAVPSWVA